MLLVHPKCKLRWLCTYGLDGWLIVSLLDHLMQYIHSKHANSIVNSLPSHYVLRHHCQLLCLWLQCCTLTLLKWIVSHINKYKSSSLCMHVVFFRALVMTGCWHENPEERPRFGDLTTRLEVFLSAMVDYVQLKRLSVQAICPEEQGVYTYV